MVPLADRMRPQTLAELVGQEHIIALGKLLHQAIKNKQLFSMIFWGPPGVGKTTLEIAANSVHLSGIRCTNLMNIWENL